MVLQRPDALRTMPRAVCCLTSSGRDSTRGARTTLQMNVQDTPRVSFRGSERNRSSGRQGLWQYGNKKVMRRSTGEWGDRESSRARTRSEGSARHETGQGGAAMVASLQDALQTQSRGPSGSVAELPLRQFNLEQVRHSTLFLARTETLCGHMSLLIAQSQRCTLLRSGC